ncbi:Light-harvesting complex-like protein OHP2, chloroplastic [Porphyridium purpureum]|uniref:Light-harvesting complex-like protein OHP2, chloroplastic n=1 Tax=Porphyridium purpureum TaxID=35688 RepID=A0A5J4YWB8_PORPP|nr:Light-harvesting complex-like protein OHP2, chloroplastic [Porphyridium purpureum]|eukprot:POR1338..scf209_3
MAFVAGGGASLPQAGRVRALRCRAAVGPEDVSSRACVSAPRRHTTRLQMAAEVEDGATEVASSKAKEENNSQLYEGPGPGMRELTPAELAEQKKVLVALSEEWKAERMDREFEQSRLFGLTRRAEILNGRVAMFFLATGLLTEYWTGENIPEQVETLFRTLGLI